jgi:hypothetical protein
MSTRDSARGELILLPLREGLGEGWTVQPCLPLPLPLPQGEGSSKCEQG